MKQVTVSGAVSLRTNPETDKKEIFATQRGYGDWKGWWEFPGGKLEAGGTPEACIEREMAFKENSAFCCLAACGLADFG